MRSTLRVIGRDLQHGTISGNNIQDYFSATQATAGINLGTTVTPPGRSRTTDCSRPRPAFTPPPLRTTVSSSARDPDTPLAETRLGSPILREQARPTWLAPPVEHWEAPSRAHTRSAAIARDTISSDQLRLHGRGRASDIQGNTIAGHAYVSSSSSATAWVGILVSSGNANIGTTTGNTIGATSGGGGASAASIYLATTTTGGSVSGINATSVNTVNIQNNTIGSVDAVGTTSAISGGFQGIGSSEQPVSIPSTITPSATATRITSGQVTRPIQEYRAVT